MEQTKHIDIFTKPEEKQQSPEHISGFPVNLKVLRILKNPHVILTLFVLVLFLVNYKPATYLTGWDNLHPEFNFWLNIKRSLFAVWQEYQGLGLLGGHAHASDLIRQLFLFLLSFLIPNSLLRYISTFFCLWLGGEGAYVLINLLLQLTEQKQSKHIPVLAFIGGLYYLLNLSTVQTFYVPFEGFITHYAALPWLLYGSLRFLFYPSKRSTMFLFIILLLSTPQAYIPTLFLVYMLTLSLLVGVLFLQKPTHFFFIQTIKLYVLTLLVNSFWLFSFIYFTVTNAHVNLLSKINQMATTDIYLRNKEFGGILDVIQLKGFWFENVDINRTGTFNYMLKPWRDFMHLPLITILGFLLFGVILIGLSTVFTRKQPILRAFFLLFLAVLIPLGLNTIPFSLINAAIRSSFPLLNQAFRFPYTKFSIVASLVYAVFFTYGISRLITRFSAKIVLFITSIMLIIFTFPAFQGHLLYDKERLTIPHEYFQLFAFFKNQDKTTRIANFPQHTFWGWNFYSWGYGGSGFLWYGIEQPILDRAFDVWSKEDENYYFELSQAVYAKDTYAFKAVLNKYAIDWIVVDKNIIYPPSPNSLLYAELPSFFKQSNIISKKITFGNIDVYKIARSVNNTSFVRLAPTLPKVNGNTWNNQDQAYRTIGDYDSTPDNKSSYDYIYPFPSLFSGKSQDELAYSLKEDRNSLILETTIPPTTNHTLIIPSWLETENIIPATIIKEPSATVAAEISLEIQTIGVSLNNRTFLGETIKIPLASVQSANTVITVNGLDSTSIAVNTNTLMRTFLTVHQNNTISISEPNGPKHIVTITPNMLAQFPLLQKQFIPIPASATPQKFTITIPKILSPYYFMRANGKALTDINSCNLFRQGSVQGQLTQQNGTSELEYTAKNAVACNAIYLPNQPHQQGYAIFITSANLTGQPFHFWIHNIPEQYGTIDTYLPQGNGLTTSTFILPPQEKESMTYALHFDTISIGNDVSQNVLNQISVYPIPYSLLINMYLKKNTYILQNNNQFTPKSVTHPAEYLYAVTIPNDVSTKHTLILDQAYNPGWQAYVVTDGNNSLMNLLQMLLPTLVGRKIQSHIKVNHWENGWIFSQEMTNNPQMKIILVYLPQYLEFAGFMLLLIFTLSIALKLLKKVNHQ